MISLLGGGVPEAAETLGGSEAGVATPCGLGRQPDVRAAWALRSARLGPTYRRPPRMWRRCGVQVETGPEGRRRGAP